MNYLIRFAATAFVFLLVFYLGSNVLQADDADEGTIIQIGPDRGANPQGNTAPRRDPSRPGRRVPNPEQMPVVVSQYWIGIEGGAPSPALRSQLELEPEEGILVNRVMPNSPAEEGELEPFDIITRVNGKQVNSIPELAEHVGEQGERKGRLAIEIIRKGKPRTVWVSPVERPVDQLTRPQPRMPFGADGPFGLRPFGQNPFGEFSFGGEGLQNFNQQMVVNGVSIKVSQQNGGPRKIVVEKGGETWEIEGDDAESLKELPDDLRPMVERMLAPRQGNGFDGFGQNNPLQERLEAMQRQIEAMQQPFGLEEMLTDEQLEEAVDNAEPSEIELPPENSFRRF